MEHIFAGYPYAVIVDDILFFGHTEMEHNDNLERVLEQAIQVNLKHQRLKPSVKCQSPQMLLLFRDLSTWSTTWASSSLFSVKYLPHSASSLTKTQYGVG